MSLKIGELAPEIKTVDAKGNSYTLSDFKGSYIVLYFYPEDETPGCTIEACSFRDNYSEFPKHKAVVFGVSGDDAVSHEKFATNHKLPFPLLIDTDHKISETYEAYGQKNFFGNKYMGVKRKTYLIDPQGRIAYIWKRVTPIGHAAEVLAKIDELASSDNIS